MVLVKICKLCIPKTKPVFFQNEKSFLNWKFFYEKTSKIRVCVYMYLSNPPPTLSFTFYLKTKSSKTNLDTSLHLLEVFTWRLLIFLTWSKHDPIALWIKPCKLQILCWSSTPTKILIMNLSLIKHKIISTITTWVDHHQN